KLAKYEEAAADLQEAIKLDQGSALYHRELGIVYSKNDQPEASISEFDEALRIDAADAETWNTRGGVLRRLGMQHLSEAGTWDYLLRARDSYNKAFELDALSNYALGNMARLDLILAKFDTHRRSTAFRELKRLKSLCEFKLDDENAEGDDRYWLLFDYADSCLLSGDIDQGKILYTKALDEVPEEYRGSVLSSVKLPLEELLALQVLDDRINAAAQEVIEQISRALPG